MAESRSNDWRELCAAAAKEQDAAKLTCLVNQIIEAIDQTLPHSRARNASRGDGRSRAREGRGRVESALI